MTDHNVEYYVRKWYAAWIRPYISKEVNRQRLKLIWTVWGYRFLFSLNTLPLPDRLRLLVRFLNVDWHVVHGHSPAEISIVCRAIAERPALSNEGLIEAGCWQGGSSAKLSILCERLNYCLHIYDSFEGVESMSADDKVESHDFSGEYASPESVLRQHLTSYGELSVCTIHKGWFSDTLAKDAVPCKVRLAFIDCDLAKGTREVLTGIVPALTDDGWIFSQDFHIKPVQKLLYDTATWDSLERGRPTIKRLGRRLASIRFRDN
jgi:O-methyltransferase